MKFRLKEKDDQGNKIGAHRDGSVRYHRGDIIESDKPLDEILRNKFERVAESTPVSEGEYVPAAKDKQKPDIPQPKKVEPVKHEAGEEALEESPASEPAAKKKPSRSKHGKDVTADFPDAILLKFKVYHKAKIFTVIDEDGNVAVKKSKSPTNITKFLEKQLD